MRKPTVLLVQLRSPDDPMLDHEAGCVQRKVAPHVGAMIRRNALAEPAEPGWAKGVDAVIIGGSGDFSVHHPLSEPWVSPLRLMLDGLFAAATPIFGICFGHQLIAYHLGAEIRTSEALTEIGTVSLELTEPGGSCEVFSSLSDRFFAQTGHSDYVVDLPDELELVARGDLVEHQGFRGRDLPIYSTQFHPDLTGAEGQFRYLAYHMNFAGHVDAAASAKAERFLVDHDEGSNVLTRFAQALAAGELWTNADVRKVG